METTVQKCLSGGFHLHANICCANKHSCHPLHHQIIQIFEWCPHRIPFYAGELRSVSRFHLGIVGVCRINAWVMPKWKPPFSEKHTSQLPWSLLKCLLRNDQLSTALKCNLVYYRPSVILLSRWWWILFKKRTLMVNVLFKKFMSKSWFCEQSITAGEAPKTMIWDRGNLI